MDLNPLIWPIVYIESFNVQKFYFSRNEGLESLFYGHYSSILLFPQLFRWSEHLFGCYFDVIFRIHDSVDELQLYGDFWDNSFGLEKRKWNISQEDRLVKQSQIYVYV